MSSILDDVLSGAGNYDEDYYGGATESIVGIPAIEAELTLLALHEECADDAEFGDLIEDCATEMALYGVVDDPSIATEAAKKVVIKDYKSAKFNMLVSRAAIRIAMVNNSPLYAKYRKGRDMMIDAREAIYKKYHSQAVQEARRILKNSKNKASNMSSSGGKDIMKKIDRQISKVESSAKRGEKPKGVSRVKTPSSGI